MKKRIFVFGFLAIIFSLQVSLNHANAGIKKVAVIDFDDSTATDQQNMKNPVYILMALRGRTVAQDEKGKIGRLVTETLTTELVKDGSLKVMERSKLKKVLDEQVLSLSGAIDTTDAAKIGKLLGVSAVIIGSVTQFNVEESNIGILGLGIKTNTAKVEVNARMIDTSTGEVILAAKGLGEESRSGVKVGELFSSSGSQFESSLLGIATRKAITSIVSDLKGYESKLKDSAINTIIAYVDTEKKTYLIDSGTDSGLEKGLSLSVIKVLREIKSPTTGKILKTITEKIADLTITQIDKTSATGTCLTGKCNEIKEGDVVVYGIETGAPANAAIAATPVSINMDATAVKVDTVAATPTTISAAPAVTNVDATAVK